MAETEVLKLAVDPEVVQLWFHYEEIAMHFNELIIQYRLQLLGGTGGLLALSSFLINTKVEDKFSLARIRAFVSLIFLTIFTAAACLDIFYYSKLLSGAVKAIIELEKNIEEINMSTTIKAQFGDGGASFFIRLVYLIVFLPLLISTVVFWIQFLNMAVKNKKKNATSAT